jgi:hypothetical protein
MVIFENGGGYIKAEDVFIQPACCFWSFPLPSQLPNVLVCVCFAIADGFLLCRGPVTGAATFNVFGQDHARLQGLATPTWRGHQGHATHLLKQLEALLTDADCKQLVVILEPKEVRQLLEPQL